MLVSVSNAKVPQKVLKQGGKGGFVQRNFASRKGNSGSGTIAGGNGQGGQNQKYKINMLNLPFTRPKTHCINTHTINA
jgi:hypothetical protein